AAPRRRHRRRLRRPTGQPEALAPARRGHTRRSAQFPSLPAARLPGGHRRRLAGRDLLPAAAHLPPPAQRARRARRGGRLRPRRAPRRAARRRAGHPPATLEYDTLIVSGGSQYSYFGHDEWQEHAAELKSLEGALTIRRRILEAFEAAE